MEGAVKLAATPISTLHDISTLIPPAPYLPSSTSCSAPLRLDLLCRAQHSCCCYLYSYSTSPMCPIPYIPVSVKRAFRLSSFRSSIRPLVPQVRNVMAALDSHVPVFTSNLHTWQASDTGSAPLVTEFGSSPTGAISQMPGPLRSRILCSYTMSSPWFAIDTMPHKRLRNLGCERWS